VINAVVNKSEGVVDSRSVCALGQTLIYYELLVVSLRQTPVVLNLHHVAQLKNLHS